MENTIQLTTRFTQGAGLRPAGARPAGKATQVPYIAHLLGVASLVVGDVSDPDL